MTDPNDLAYPKVVSSPARDRNHGPYTDTHSTGGLTKRELEAIELRVPMSGDDQIDAMIRVANRRDAAAMAMQGLLSDRRTMTDLGEAFAVVNNQEQGSNLHVAGLRKLISMMSVAHADALIAELNKETP